MHTSLHKFYPIALFPPTPLSRAYNNTTTTATPNALPFAPSPDLTALQLYAQSLLPPPLEPGSPPSPVLSVRRKLPQAMGLGFGLPGSRTEGDEDDEDVEGDGEGVLRCREAVEVLTRNPKRSELSFFSPASQQ